MAEVESFEIWDYIVFAAFLCISVTVGVYHAWKSNTLARVHRTESRVSIRESVQNNRTSVAVSNRSNRWWISIKFISSSLNNQKKVSNIPEIFYYKTDINNFLRTT